MQNNAKNNSSKLFMFAAEEEEVEVGEGIFRQILGFDPSIMLVRANFEEGSVGYAHAHPHSQVTYVVSGAFDFSIGGETRRLEAGDSTYIPPDVEHGAVCRSSGVLIDVFSPVREDFLEERKE